jgi:uncharacterized protein (TIGR04255 family)
VLAQVRFDPEVDNEYKAVSERLKAALGERFPAMKSVRQAMFVFGNLPVPPDAPTTNGGEVGRELRRDDNRSALRVQEGAMTYTTSLYMDSPHFLAEWQSMLECLCAAGGIKVQRMGLRYIDFIIPTAGKAPENYFKDGFSRPPSALGEASPLTAFMSYEYPKGEGEAMRVQFGRGIAPPSLPPDLDGSVLPPPALLGNYIEGPSAVLDMDRWRMDSRRLQAEEIAEEFRRFRDDIRMAFNAIITSGARAEWSGKAE